ncbi:MAG: DNA polymerase III subunit beta, partial [Spirochaetales bacterium]|nr:DNA polymerase III subunit beta [Spirochaetales bacterium]MCF7939866.1 DNA polymerase III subunit beta [Spirochaetales bacterium]
TRYFMNGVFIEKPEANLIMVATDGRRLSYIERPIDIGMTELPGSIVPPKVLTLVRKLASGEGNVQTAVTEKNIFFRFDNRKLFSALIEGQFPNYRRVIPDNQTNSVTVGKDDLETALKRVALLVEQKSKRIYLSVNGDVLRINSEDSEIGKASEEIPCTYGGEETTFALNYQYLMDPLRVMDEKTIRLRFTEPSKAMTLEGESEGDFFHIIMPMQVD